MGSVIVYTNQRGFTSVCYPTGEVPIEEVLEKDCPPGDRFITHTDQLPLQDDDFFNAWKIGPGQTISVDMPAAREIHRDRMRIARAPKLEALDIELARAQEENRPTASIIAAKQALRDVTALPAIDAAQTPAQLRAIWPDILS